MSFPKSLQESVFKETLLVHYISLIKTGELESFFTRFLSALLGRKVNLFFGSLGCRLLLQRMVGFRVCH